MMYCLFKCLSVKKTKTQGNLIMHITIPDYTNWPQSKYIYEACSFLAWVYFNQYIAKLLSTLALLSTLCAL